MSDPQPAAPAERHAFQAEVQQLLDLMVHSLYSDKDVFLRELVSNASDALDKRRFEALTRPELGGAEATIRLEVDPDARTLTIVDTGIGMSREEVVRNIGTIARSGTKEFVARIRAAQQEAGGQLPAELIGQFGVGFYSAFMVADRITLVTRRAGTERPDEATRWESAGAGEYTLEAATRAEPGTSITLHLKPTDDEHGLHDYASAAVLRRIVRRYSDFVAYPIKHGDETLNSMKAIWDRPKAEVTDAEYEEFYKHVCRDWQGPLRSLPIRMEGTLEAYALLFLPRVAPFDLYSPEMKRGLQLYVKRVFVMDECKELLPPHLRFVKGVVDAHDLSLNVSREILQKDRQIAVIRRQLVKKVMGALDELKRDHRDEYVAFWAQFGPALKEGLLAPDGPDGTDKEKLLDLVLASSTHDAAATSSLEEYVGRMKEGQREIYYLSAATREAAARSPLLERFRAKGYEVLLFSDAIDELWLEHPPTYRDRPLVSIGRGDVKLGSDDERKAEEAKLEDQQRELRDLLTCLRAHLQEEVKEVRLSSRLTDSAACLVVDAADLTPRMQRLMEQLGQAVPKAKPILELNPEHALVPRLRAIFAESSTDPRLPLFATLLLGQASLADSGHVPDPAAFGKALAELMLRAG